jgi:hypothetical protein
MTTHHDNPADARPGLPRWPLYLIGSPAAVAVWTGWVGLGEMCGFGVIHPLPGIADAIHLNTAITLPVGVEAYGAYALGAWLTPGAPGKARRFARGSAIGALALGMAGQVIYHLLAAAHATRAPWPVVMLVSCIPVVTLGFGTALTHLLRAVPVPVQAPGPVPDALPVQPALPGPDEDRRTEPDADHTEDRTGDSSRPHEVDRAAIVAELADQIRDAIEGGDRWQPDYPALIGRTGFRRSWCEKVVRDARTAAFRTAVTPPARTGTDPDPDSSARAARPALHAID